MTIKYLDSKRLSGLEYTASNLTTSGFAQTWGKDPSNSQFEVSSGRINFLDNTSSTGDRTWLDLQSIIGSAVSTTQWVLRFKFNFSTLTTGNYYYEFDAGLSDTTVNNMTNQNFIGVRVLPNESRDLWRPRTCDGSSTPRQGASASITQSFSTGTDYYVEIKRTSSSNWSISLSTTNAYDGDLQNNSYTDAGSATGLRYFKFGDAVTNSGTGFTMQGVCDVLEFYNDTNTAAATSSGDVKPTNVQDNSIFVETDTARRYWFDLGVEPKGTSGSGGDWAETSFNNSTIVNNESASGNVVTRTSGSGWNSYIRSNEYISPSTGGGEIYFTQSANTNISVGLEKSPFNPAPSATYTGKDYSFHTTSSSNNMYEHTSDYAGTAWASATNEYRITMDSAGLVKYYWRSGSSGTWTLERTSTVTASGDYYFTVSHSGTAGTITSYIKGTPVTWTMEPTFQVNFSSDPLLSSSTRVYYSSAKKIHYKLEGSAYDGLRGTIDLQTLNGGAISSSWVLDFDLNDTGVVMNDTSRLSVNFGVATNNVNNATNGGGDVGAFLGLHADIDDANAARGRYGICAYSNGVGTDPNSYITVAETIDQNQHWYVRLIKDGSADTFKAEFYTTSARTGTPLSATVTGVTWDTARYFGVWDDFNAGGSNISEGDISEIKFYNGVTTIN
jgi:hypothetical protein